VETEAELAVLAEAGCELVQGFLFSRPVDADRIAALLADGNAGE
jgi:EAL domain-containing protein (putative c-di-GMP-specific phosphodiesterase class I)